MTFQRFWGNGRGMVRMLRACGPHAATADVSPLSDYYADSAFRAPIDSATRAPKVAHVRAGFSLNLDAGGTVEAG
jgi:hypothetical protein